MNSWDTKSTALKKSLSAGSMQITTHQINYLDNKLVQPISFLRLFLKTYQFIAGTRFSESRREMRRRLSSYSFWNRWNTLRYVINTEAFFNVSDWGRTYQGRTLHRVWKVLTILWQLPQYYLNIWCLICKF